MNKKIKIQFSQPDRYKVKREKKKSLILYLQYKLKTNPFTKNLKLFLTFKNMLKTCSKVSFVTTENSSSYH